ncbi:MAG: condensation domain-containing protein, partial [Thermoactinomyces vulgaris]
REANRLHQSLRIHGGPLIRLGIFHTGEGDYLLIIIHHLVMDAVSWRVLSEDLHTAYRQQLAGEPLALPQKTTSFQSWSRQLQEFANSPALLAEIPYWKAIDRLRVPKLPVDKKKRRIMPISISASFGAASRKRKPLTCCPGRIALTRRR